MAIMRTNIFNDFPICLLAFNEKGSEIELIERNETWRRICIRMKRDFSTKFDFQTAELGGEEEAIQEFNSSCSKFAILSHTWIQDTPGEVTYADWKPTKVDKSSRGYQKLANFCRVAAIDYGVTLGWMDTICINKESSSELDESIRSMFKWYSYAEVCVTHLADIMTVDNMRHDTWFTRGWTLQELLAPSYTKFYNAEWKKIHSHWKGDLEDEDILREIQAATTIVKDELTMNLLDIPISRRMQWAANRRVTRAEDTAYSLMGIFGVSISTAYGEGPQLAFIRLIKEIIASKHDTLDIMNFGYGNKYPSEKSAERSGRITASSLVPLSPKQFLWSKPILWQRSTTPITLTHLGLHVSVLLIPGISITNLPDESRPIGRYFGTITENFLNPNNDITSGTFSLLESCIYEKPISSTIRREAVLFFAVFNFYETATTVEIAPRDSLCYAKALIPVELHLSFDLEDILSDTSKLRMLYTPQPTFFTLQSVNEESYFIIPKPDLEKHGMFLRTMYL
ncbi:hypothetical protein BDN70DRAFT_843725 [Pholiota conissans]|uniref:Heterokaryon incompatibility domain-containing protein n=1 Tax=Pholiota conissans TaxID=109636 RepID=A0A9P5YPT3_9AGAR|nr:hypothetical protein BDN70DRAFT_843725 [Pholiota conissans]